MRSEWTKLKAEIARRGSRPISPGQKNVEGPTTTPPHNTTDNYEQRKPERLPAVTETGLRRTAAMTRRSAPGRRLKRRTAGARLTWTENTRPTEKLQESFDEWNRGRDERGGKAGQNGRDGIYRAHRTYGLRTGAKKGAPVRARRERTGLAVLAQNFFSSSMYTKRPRVLCVLTS